MPTFVVTTAADTVSATDGVLSLREAIASAGAATQPATITFDQTLFSPNGPTLPPQIQLNGRLVIPQGAQITIDGSTRSLSFDVQVNGNGRILDILPGAQVTLRDLKFFGGGEQGARGIDGDLEQPLPDGAAGSGANATTPAQPGFDGFDGPDADAGTAGGLAVAGISNAGQLVLERVDLRNMDARGGDGGRGGFGANGSWGGQGGWGWTAIESEGTIGQILYVRRVQGAANGGAGGNGGDGGAGGDGGDAVGGILNGGTLTMRDVSFSSLVAIGGRAGQGGAGGRGGEGGNTGVDLGNYPNNVVVTVVNPDAFAPPQGGRGGNGGNGANGGHGGDAYAALLNRGQVVIEGDQSSAQVAEGRGGLGGVGVSAGGAGFGGQPTGRDPRISVDQSVWPGALSGGNGTPGAVSGFNGAAGSVVDFGGTNVQTTPDTFIVEASTDAVRETDPVGGRYVSFMISRLGNPFASRTVEYTITGSSGLTVDDFDPGTGTTADYLNGRLGTGVATFASGRTNAYINFLVRSDTRAEGDETFTLTIRDVSGDGGIGWSRSVSVAILSPLVHGGAASDRLPGTAGADAFTGGRGNDVFTVNNRRDTVTELAGEGRDTVLSSVNFVLPAHVENITLTGRNAINATGNDIANFLTGNAGANRLSGRSGNDTLIGGEGNDTLTGGVGADRFRFDALDDGTDRIADFTRSDRDRLEISRAGFDLSANFRLTAATLINDDNPVARGSGPAFLFDTDSGRLIFDANGSAAGGQTVLATLSGVPALAAADVLFVP
jgi:Ca2+-binding RTX toxin-like protein